MAIESPGRRGSLSSSCPMPPTRTAPPEAGGLRPRSGPRPPRDAPPPPPLSPEPRVCSSPKVEQASSLSGHSLRGSSLGAGVDAGLGSAPHRGAAWGGAWEARPSPASLGRRARPPPLAEIFRPPLPWPSSLLRAQSLFSSCSRVPEGADPQSLRRITPRAPCLPTSPHFI